MIKMNKKGNLASTILIIIVIIILGVMIRNKLYDNDCIIEEMEEFCNGEVIYNQLTQNPFQRDPIYKFSCVEDNKEEKYIFTKYDIRRCKY